MVTITISSGSTDNIKNTFLKFIENGIIIPNNILKCHFRFNVQTLADNIFDFIDSNGNTYSLDRMSLGYNGTGPNDLLTCIRAAGFGKELIPREYVTTDYFLKGQIIEFWAVKPTI